MFLGKSDKIYFNSNEEPVVIRTSVLRLVFLGVVVITPAITPGMAVGFSAIALPQLNLDLDAASWFTSIVSIGTPLGNLFTGLVIDKYGRRASLILSIIPSIFGWMLLTDSESSLIRMYAGRLLTGFALGAISLPSTLYAAECITINNSLWRNSLSTWTTIAISVGILLSYFLGAIMKYYEVAYVACALSILSLFMILYFIPESPMWLFRQGRFGDAELATIKLGISQPILLDVKYPREAIDFRRGDEPELSFRNLWTYLVQIERREVYKPLLITIVFLFFLQFSGVLCVTAYMVDVIRVDSFPYDSYILAIISGCLQIVGLVCLTFVLPIRGVKMISITSLFGVAAGFLCLGVSVAVKDENYRISLDYLHIFSVWAIVLSSAMGLIATPYSILGEIFPMDAKGYASLSLVASSAFNFVILHIYLHLYDEFGSFVYFAFSFICLCGVIFVDIVLPETVGKTMEEIKDGFV